MHCGHVHDGNYKGGRKVSVNIAAEVLYLTNQRSLADGGVLKKIERFSMDEMESYFLKDGHKLTGVIPRLNTWQDPKNWLSMRPGPQSIRIEDWRISFREIDEDNKLHGRCIEIKHNGHMVLG